MYTGRQQIEYEGYGSHKRISDVIKTVNAKKIMLVCGSGFDKSPAKQILETASVPVVYFRNFSPNPDYVSVLEGVDLFAKEQCDFIISIGGGSAIDVAKSIKFHCAENRKELRHLAIPTTAGTGSEATRFAVVYKNGEKESIEHISMIPDYIILDPIFLKTLPDYHKKCSLLDALCQAIESMWAKEATNESREYAKEATNIILQNVDRYLLEKSEDMEIMYSMLKAANLSGKAINISKTTAAHAMSYKLTSIFGIAHGHAVALCLPHVWENMFENNLMQRDIFDNPKQIFDMVTGLFNKLNIHQKFEYSEDTIQKLVASVNLQRLNNHPIELSANILREIYCKVLANQCL
jgi:alcohol dehydrogenase class IV